MQRTQTIAKYLDSSFPSATVQPLFVADTNQLKATLETETAGRVFFHALLSGLRLRAKIDQTGPRIEFPVRVFGDAAWPGFADSLQTEPVWQSAILSIWFRAGDLEQWREIGQAPLLNKTNAQFLNWDLVALCNIPKGLGHRAQLGVSVSAPLQGGDWVELFGTVEEQFELPPVSGNQTTQTFSTVTAAEVPVDDTVDELMAVNTDRLKFSLFHEADDELLIDFGRDPTLTSYGFALPAKHLWYWEGWQGDIRGISRSGNAITVHVREFAA